MKPLRPLAILGTFSLGIFAAWTLPSEWFIWTLQICVGAGFILAILASIDAKEDQPPHSAIKTISYVTLGTSRPTATLGSTVVLWLFYLSASYVFGALLGMIGLGFF